LPSARIDRSWSRSPSRTIFQKLGPSPVGERDVHVPYARQLDIQAVELLVGRVAEVEDRVQPQRRQERRVLGGGVREVAAAEEPSVPYGRPSTVGRPPTSRKLRTPARSGSVGGTCCGTSCVT